jgi:4-hydroxybenzoyl-CoA thioesterase
MSFTHATPFTVEFGDCDPAQIVFYPNFLRWTDAASLRFFAAAGIAPWHQRAEAAHDGIIGTPVVEIDVRFVAPATYGDAIIVETTVTDWRRTSFVMDHRVCRDDTLLVTARETRVFARRHPSDPRRIEAVPIPADIRSRFEPAG